jgi:hypothetical protein
VRYFTRELYERYSRAALSPSDGGFEERVEKEGRAWSEANQRYLDYLRSHDGQLSEAVRKLKSYALHDAIVTRVQIGPDTVQLFLDTQQTPMVQDGSVYIAFRGVREAYGLHDLVNQAILYEELYVHGDGTFEFSVLCSRSEAGVQFAGVEIRSQTTY